MNQVKNEASTSDDIAKSIGRVLATYRQSANLTQAEVAEKLGISNDAVSRMERGGIMPSVARLIQFAEIFDCTTAELIGASSPNLTDQAQHLHRLLKQLNPVKREKLISIIEAMVEWQTDN